MVANPTTEFFRLIVRSGHDTQAQSGKPWDYVRATVMLGSVLEFCTQISMHKTVNYSLSLVGDDGSVTFVAARMHKMKHLFNVWRLQGCDPHFR